MLEPCRQEYFDVFHSPDKWFSQSCKNTPPDVHNIPLQCQDFLCHSWSEMFFTRPQVSHKVAYLVYISYGICAEACICVFFTLCRLRNNGLTRAMRQNILKHTCTVCIMINANAARSRKSGVDNEVANPFSVASTFVGSATMSALKVSLNIWR